MENNSIALAFAVKHGFKNVQFEIQFKEYDAYTAFVQIPDEPEIAIILVKDGGARFILTQEELDDFMDATFPPCL